MEGTPQEKYRTFSKGQTVFKEGQQNPVAYMVKRGRVSVYRVVNNRRVVLATVKPGQIFGEMALITGDPFHATAEAEEYSELIPLDRQLLQSLLLKCPNPVQRIMRYLMDRLKVLDRQVLDQPGNNVFLSLCHLLELCHRAQDPKQPGVSYAEFSRTAKNVLLVSQLEIDRALEKLARLNLVGRSDVKEARFERDAFGDMAKSHDKLKDRRLHLTDPASFLNVARNLSRESAQQPEDPYTQGLEFVDMQDFAALAGISTELAYKKLAHQEVPENVFFFHRGAAQRWIEETGHDRLKRTRRKRLNVDELEGVDDVVDVDDAALQQAFAGLGFHKLAMLFAVAGEDARAKILANCSRKIGEVVREEAQGMRVQDAEVASVEDELIGLIKQAKGA
jgi:CRP-like cAMP-binding protein